MTQALGMAINPNPLNRTMSPHFGSSLFVAAPKPSHTCDSVDNGVLYIGWFHKLSLGDIKQILERDDELVPDGKRISTITNAALIKISGLKVPYLIF